MVSKLKTKRIEAGFTQTSLAEASGVNIKSIASYEQDSKKLNKAAASSVVKIADSLGCTVEDLIDRTIM